MTRGEGGRIRESERSREGRGGAGGWEGSFFYVLSLGSYNTHGPPEGFLGWLAGFLLSMNMDKRMGWEGGGMNKCG